MRAQPTVRNRLLNPPRSRPRIFQSQQEPRPMVWDSAGNRAGTKSVPQPVPQEDLALAVRCAPSEIESSTGRSVERVRYITTPVACSGALREGSGRDPSENPMEGLNEDPETPWSAMPAAGRRRRNWVRACTSARADGRKHSTRQRSLRPGLR